MTPEQAKRCDELAKKIAEFGPRGSVLGVACRDGGRFWRRTHMHPTLFWPGWTNSNGVHVWQDEDSGAAESLRTAIANGPAWEDASTMGALLLSLGEEVGLDRSWTLLGTQTGWFWRSSWRNDKESTFYQQGPLCETPQEAILSAKLVQLKT